MAVLRIKKKEQRRKTIDKYEFLVMNLKLENLVGFKNSISFAVNHLDEGGISKNKLKKGFDTSA